MLKSLFFGFFKRFNICLICAGGFLGDFYVIVIYFLVNRDFLYMEIGLIFGFCINLV